MWIPQFGCCKSKCDHWKIAALSILEAALWIPDSWGVGLGLGRVQELVLGLVLGLGRVLESQQLVCPISILQYLCCSNKELHLSFCTYSIDEYELRTFSHNQNISQ